MLQVVAAPKMVHVHKLKRLMFMSRLLEHLFLHYRACPIQLQEQFQILADASSEDPTLGTVTVTVSEWSSRCSNCALTAGSVSTWDVSNMRCNSNGKWYG